MVVREPAARAGSITSSSFKIVIAFLLFCLASVVELREGNPTRQAPHCLRNIQVPQERVYHRAAHHDRCSGPRKPTSQADGHIHPRWLRVTRWQIGAVVEFEDIRHCQVVLILGYPHSHCAGVVPQFLSREEEDEEGVATSRLPQGMCFSIP